MAFGEIFLAGYSGESRAGILPAWVVNDVA